MTQTIINVETVHRHVFLQTLMKRSFVPAKEAEDLLRSLYGGKHGMYVIFPLMNGSVSHWGVIV